MTTNKERLAYYWHNACLVDRLDVNADANVFKPGNRYANTYSRLVKYELKSNPSLIGIVPGKVAVKLHYEQTSNGIKETISFSLRGRNGL